MVLARQSEFPKADTGMYTFEFHAPGHFSNESRAWDWVDYAAHSSSPLFDRVDGPDGVEGNDYRAVATQMVPLSARTSAGFLYRMLETFDAGPPTANAGPDLIVSAGALIELDARRSIDDMAIHGYEWRLPDGIVTHEFLASFQARSDGEYEVELIVTDAFGKSSSDMVRIRVTQVTSPVRVVLPQITEAVAGVPVSVTLDLSDGSVPSYVVWALDSETSNGPVFQHTFWRPGLYTVRVRVMTSSGLLLNGEFLVKVRDVLSPAASILAPAEAHTGELVSFSGFDSSDDSGIVDYYWSFGDGTTTRGPVVEHRYDSEGAFIVTLEVADSDGNRDRATVIIRVLLIPYTPGVGVNLWDFLTPLMIAFMILSGTYLAFWVMRVPSQRSHRNRKSASNTGEKKT